MDEKSKATIEKMLLEEQQYLSRKAAKPRRTVQNKLMNSPEKTENNLISSSSRRVWSEQEKQMLLKGMVRVNLTCISLAFFLWDIGKKNSPRCDAAELGIPSGDINSKI